MTDLEIVKKLLSLYKNYRWYIILSIPCALIVSVIPGSSAVLVKPLIDKVFLEKNLAWLKIIPLAVVILYFIKALARFAQGYLLRVAGQKVVRDLRKKLFEHILFLSMGFFDKSNTGSLISRLSYDVSLIQMLAPSSVNLIKEPLTLLWLTGLLFYIDFKMAVLSLVLLPVAGLGIWHFSKRVREKTRVGQEEMGELTNRMQESFSGSKIVKAYLAEEREIEKFSLSNNHFFNTMKGVIKYSEILSPIVEFVGALGIGFIIFYGGYRVVVEKELTAGSFLAFLTAVGMMYEPYRQLSRINAVVQSGLSAGKRIFELLILKPEVIEDLEAVEFKEFKKSITFKNVWFAYNSSEYKIKNLNLEIKKNEILGIVGEIGSGKSTIGNLLMRFYDVQRGEILIDDVNIKKIKLRDLRKNISLITQDVFLFNDTIEENIKYGKWDASEDEVRRAAQLAGIDDFIKSLPRKYKTMVGEKGVLLSGGQRQKIAIARAFLKNAPILVLDEATSNLDPESEEEVKDVIFNLMKGKTVIIISHRLSFLQKADKIVVMENGEKKEEGSHHLLVSRKGIYYEMLNKARV